MVQDVSATTYANGDPVQEAKTPDEWKRFCAESKGCYRRLANGSTIYNGFAVNDSRGLLPDGFRVPEFADFNQLFDFLGGGASAEGEATKALATYKIFVEDWIGDEIDGGLESVEIETSGKSGFAAVPGGYVYDFGETGGEGPCNYWWTNSKDESGIIVVDIGYCSNDLGGGKGSFSAGFGFSIRGIKND